MVSPIKDIVSKYPTQLKEYKPELYDIKKTGQRPNIEGWSYYGKYAKWFVHNITANKPPSTYLGNIFNTIFVRIIWPFY